MPNDEQTPRQVLLRAVIGVACAAIGGGVVVALIRESAIPGAVILPAVMFPVWFGGGALIGGGLFHLALRWRLGAALSVPVQAVLLATSFRNYF